MLLFVKGLVFKKRETKWIEMSLVTAHFESAFWRKEEEMRLGSRLIQPPGKKGSFRWLIFRCNCIAPWHQLWAANRAHPQHLYHCSRGTSPPFCRTAARWKQEAHGQWENPHTFTGNRLCDDREIPQVICATLWIALFFFSLPFLLSAQLCFLIHCAPYEEH